MIGIEINIVDFYSLLLRPCGLVAYPGRITMHVSVRSTWLNSEALSRDKDIFFEKKKMSLYTYVYSIYTYINVVNSKGCFCQNPEKTFFGEILKKTDFWKKSDFWKKIIFYFSSEKSNELSQVGRSLTCIGADKEAGLHRQAIQPR